MHTDVAASRIINQSIINANVIFVRGFPMFRYLHLHHITMCKKLFERSKYTFVSPNAKPAGCIQIPALLKDVSPLDFAYILTRSRLDLGFILT